MMRYIKSYQIDSLGVEWPDYFQGYGSGDYERAVTGIGMNAVEAYDDALELMEQEGTEIGSMPKRPPGIRKSDKVPAHSQDYQRDENAPYYYVGIRYNVTADINEKEDDGRQYSIVRYYRPKPGRPTRKSVIETCVTLGYARAHCSNPSTSSENYFDGFVRQ